MSERRLHAEALPQDGGIVELSESAARHARVLRLQPGDRVQLFDGTGLEASAEVLSVAPDTLRCEARAPRRQPAPPARVVLVQALPKGSKLETLLRMATEIGVEAVRLAHARHSVARPDAARAAKRMERLRRVAEQAARQSERSRIPSLHAPYDLLDVAAEAPADAARMYCDASASATIGDMLDAHAGSLGAPEEIWLAVGPEGGFAPEEQSGLQRLGYRPASLATATLRVETAAPVAVALALDWPRRRRPRHGTKAPRATRTPR